MGWANTSDGILVAFPGQDQEHGASAARLHAAAHLAEHHLSFVYSSPDYSSVIIVEVAKLNMRSL
jgi:hypothetical protein